MRSGVFSAFASGAVSFMAALTPVFPASAADPSRPPAEESPFRIQESDEGVLISEGDRKVLFYQRTPKSLDGRYRRANYVHPLYGLDGEVLTEDFPEDHRHHRGIFWAWHQVWVGRTRMGDGWATRDFDWDVQSVRPVASDAGSAGLEARVLWKSPALKGPTGDLVPFVEERAFIRAHRRSDALRLIDFEIRLRALQPDVRIGGSEDEKGYGGFSVRIKLPDDLEFSGTDGPVQPQITAVDAGPWLNMSSRGRGLAILTHPANPQFPQPWILRPARSMQNPAWPGRHPVPLSEDEPLVLRYRLALHRGQLDRAALDKLQAECSDETP
jgi:hypothetical protein